LRPRRPAVYTPPVDPANDGLVPALPRVAEGDRMNMTFAAVGAIIAAVLESTLVRHVEIGSAHLHLVLILAVLWTTVADVDGGLIVAFVGGLTLDALVARPLGSTAFVTLLAVGLAYLMARPLARFRLVMPALAVLAGSLLASFVLLIIYGALRGPIQADDPLSFILPSAIADTFVAAILTPFAVAIRNRARSPERVDW
jgi:rod shape-determining protein MreD